MTVAHAAGVGSAATSSRGCLSSPSRRERAGARRRTGCSACTADRTGFAGRWRRILPRSRATGRRAVGSRSGPSCAVRQSPEDQIVSSVSQRNRLHQIWRVGSAGAALLLARCCDASHRCPRWLAGEESVK